MEQSTDPAPTLLESNITARPVTPIEGRLSVVPWTVAATAGLALLWILDAERPAVPLGGSPAVSGATQQARATGLVAVVAGGTDTTNDVAT